MQGDLEHAWLLIACPADPPWNSAHQAAVLGHQQKQGHTHTHRETHAHTDMPDPRARLLSPSSRPTSTQFHPTAPPAPSQENPQGLAARTGHTELSIALAKAAGVTPVMVGCVMLSNDGDDYGALGPDAAKAWADKQGVPFLEGPELVEHVLGKAANGSA